MFTASNGCLEKRKAAYSTRETRIPGENDEVLIPTIKPLIEMIPGLVRCYKLEDIWNMDELELLFKLLRLRSDIISEVFKRLDRKMKMQNRNVLIFLVNATSNQKLIEKNLSNIKAVFLHKNTPSTPYRCWNN